MTFALFSTCGFCGQDIANPMITTCAQNAIIEFPDDSALPAIKWTGTGRCPECNVQPGGNHHPGCQLEICPKCGDPLEQCMDLQ